MPEESQSSNKKKTEQDKKEKLTGNQSKDDKFVVTNPLWLSANQTATLLGVKKKTIKRAIKSNLVKYKIERNKYLIEFESAIEFAHDSRRLENKLYRDGIGQYVKIFRTGKNRSNKYKK